MGAVQKLATVVIIGLVAMATVLVVYLADEPSRRGGESTEQEALALERGTALYITYCLQCHGPSGYGAANEGEEPRRVGAVLNQSIRPPDLSTPTNVQFQSDDPVQQDRAEDYIRYSLLYGKPSDPRVANKVMPAFGQELNVEEINDLVYLVMYGDWNYIYNEAVLSTGESVAQAECDADPSNTEACEAVEHPEPVYPTVPPEDSAGDGGDPEASPASSEGGSTLLEALDPYEWSETELSFQPGDTIEVVNAGVSQHNFVVEELGIQEDLTAEPIAITIPEDAAPGEYEFICSIPGHAENGMVGTLTIEAP
ncbi:MAG: c-type cytochrome [Chloroflexota bacterium]|nr:c-type cytochrome [Chloroflexia bacterium]MDQ3444442.1 c-type cytochrome [Chloroflexota bacterium]